MSATIYVGDLIKTITAVYSPRVNGGWINQGTIGKVVAKSSFRVMHPTIYTVEFQHGTKTTMALFDDAPIQPAYKSELYATAIKKLTLKEGKQYREQQIQPKL